MGIPGAVSFFKQRFIVTSSIINSNDSSPNLRRGTCPLPWQSLEVRLQRRVPVPCLEIAGFFGVIHAPKSSATPGVLVVDGPSSELTHMKSHRDRILRKLAYFQALAQHSLVRRLCLIHSAAAATVAGSIHFTHRFTY